MPIKIYWDSCVFIHLLDDTPRYRNALLPLVDAAKKGKVLLVTSALALAEVAYTRNYGRQDAAKIAQLRSFFLNPYINVRAVDMNIGNQASEIVRRYGISGADAVHIATAIAADVDVMHTTDGHKEDGSIDTNTKKMLANAAALRSKVKIDIPNLDLLAIPEEPPGLFKIGGSN